jgi:hypothetical protein
MSGSGVGRSITRNASDGRGNGLRVALTTIDNLADEFKLDRVDFIKMDIEGAEVDALLGAHDTLSKYRPRLAVAGYHNREDSETIPRAVYQAATDYQMRYGAFYHPAWVRPQALFFH